MCHSARAPSGRTHSAHRTEKRLGYCIAHNPLLFQPLRHWFTFIYRKCEHLAVEDFIVKDLLDSRGSCLWLLPCFPLLWWLEWDLNPHSPLAQQSSYQLNDPTISFVPLLYHTLRGLSRGFLTFFKKFSWGKAPAFGSLLTLPP